MEATAKRATNWGRWGKDDERGTLNLVDSASEEFIPVHRELLHRRGILMAEHVVLAELAAADAHEFLFVASPLRITGATGSPFNPVAIA